VKSVSVSRKPNGKGEIARAATTRMWDGRVEFDYNRPIIQNNDGEIVAQMPELWWLKLIEIKGHYYLLFHGHGVRSAYGIPYYGLLRRAMMWRSAFPQRWSVLLCGHYHQFGMVEENDILIMLNGTTVQGDLWALETFGLRGINQTWCFGVSQSRPVTWTFRLDLRP